MEWDQVINDKLEKADLILLLISSDFINSKYAYGIEMNRAISRHAEKNARIIPIIARPCLWQALPFAKLQTLPKEAKAITTWQDRDSAYLSVVQGIENVAKELLEQSSSIISEWVGSLLARRKVTRLVQVFLKNKGWYKSSIDGNLNNIHLRNAVARFQKSVGINDDGLIGPETLRQISLELEN